MNKFLYYATATAARAFYVLMWVFLLLLIGTYISLFVDVIEEFFQWVFCVIEVFRCRDEIAFSHLEYRIREFLFFADDKHALAYAQNIVYCFVMYCVASYYKAVFKSKLSIKWN